MENWKKWKIQAENCLDHLKAEIEAEEFTEVFSLATGEDLSAKLALVFILDLFAKRIEDELPLRCGISIEEFKQFLGLEYS